MRLAWTSWLIGTSLLAAPALAQQNQVEERIVVTGVRIDDSDRKLRECLARKCPPLEDIAATLAHAENQFIAGDYRDARKTLRASLGRNRGSAKKYPIAVSGLYRADARIAIHMGEGEDHQTSATGVVRALKAGLPDDHPQVLIGQFDVAQMHINLGRYHSAIQVYDSISRNAKRIGAKNIAGQADLRSAWLSHSFNSKGDGRRRLEALTAGDDPHLRTIRTGARILLARIDRAAGKAVPDSLIAELAGAKFKRTLLFAPPMQPLKFGVMGDSNRSGAAEQRDPYHFSEAETNKETWIDVGFRVRADGRVEEAEILRKSGRTDWTTPVLKSISARIYSPSPENEDDYRVERYSLTSLKMDATGTRFRRHSGDWYIEQIDLTTH